MILEFELVSELEGLLRVAACPLLLCTPQLSAHELVGQFKCLPSQASEMASKALQSEDMGEDEMQPAPKLLEVILQNCRGRVDQYLTLYMQARPGWQSHFFHHSHAWACVHWSCMCTLHLPTSSFAKDATSTKPPGRAATNTVIYLSCECHHHVITMSSPLFYVVGRI